MQTGFQVRPDYNNPSGGYLVNVHTGKNYTARNLQEVVYALQHYFKESIAEYPYDYEKHVAHSKECDCCPLCRKP